MANYFMYPAAVTARFCIQFNREHSLPPSLPAIAPGTQFQFTLETEMKKLILLLIFSACAVPAASAQENDRMQVGVFADYFRASQTNSNFAGLGGRFTFTAYRGLK